MRSNRLLVPLAAALALALGCAAGTSGGQPDAGHVDRPSLPSDTSARPDATACQNQCEAGASRSAETLRRRT